MQDWDFSDSDIFYGIAVNADNSGMSFEDIESSIQNGSTPNNGIFNAMFVTVALAIDVVARMIRLE